MSVVPARLRGRRRSLSRAVRHASVSAGARASAGSRRFVVCVTLAGTPVVERFSALTLVVAVPLVLLCFEERLVAVRLLGHRVLPSNRLRPAADVPPRQVRFPFSSRPYREGVLPQLSTSGRPLLRRVCEEHRADDDCGEREDAYGAEHAARERLVEGELAGGGPRLAREAAW